MYKSKNHNLIFIFIYGFLFVLGIKTLFHGFPDIERFFAEWMDERLTLTYIMKFGTLNFAPTEIWHPPLYHYLTFIPIGSFFIVGKLAGLFYDKIDFVRFYFNNTHYFFFMGRMMSYLFFWLSAIIIYKSVGLYHNSLIAHITTLSYLLIPRFIFDFATTRPETLLFLNILIFFYFFLKYYLEPEKVKYLFISAFFLGVATATKYNALYLGSIFIPLFFIQLNNQRIFNKIFYKEFLTLLVKIGFFVFLGFFICNPFFIICVKKYFYNLKTYTAIYTTDTKNYCIGYHSLNHLKELISSIYLNIFGFLILLIGCNSLFKKDRKLFGILMFVSLIYEIYFGIFFKTYSPLRYLNPLLPMAVLIFSAGISFIVEHKKKFGIILILFLATAAYNYFDIWQGLSLGKTYLQNARAFIEKNVPEFTTICIASNSYLPQLNMTKASYYHLIKTAPVLKNIQGREITYEKMDNEENYDKIFREIRLESLTKKPQYNLIRWDDGIQTEKEATGFIKKNNIQYIISSVPFAVAGKDVKNTGLAFLLKEFGPLNPRIYETAFGKVSLYLYKVKNDKS